MKVGRIFVIFVVIMVALSIAFSGIQAGEEKKPVKEKKPTKIKADVGAINEKEGTIILVTGEGKLITLYTYGGTQVFQIVEQPTELEKINLGGAVEVDFLEGKGGQIADVIRIPPVKKKKEE